MAKSHRQKGCFCRFESPLHDQRTSKKSKTAAGSALSQRKLVERSDRKLFNNFKWQILMNRWSRQVWAKATEVLVMTLLFGEKINILHGSRGVITEIGIPSMAGKLTTSLQYQAVAVMPLAIYVRYTGKTISELLMEGCLAY